MTHKNKRKIIFKKSLLLILILIETAPRNAEGSPIICLEKPQLYEAALFMKLLKFGLFSGIHEGLSIILEGTTN